MGPHISIQTHLIYAVLSQSADLLKISNTFNNSSIITGFILLASLAPGGADSSLCSFSAVYLLTLIGNGSIICAVLGSEPPHPMYILLANFSFLEIWHVTSTVPNMLANFSLTSSSSLSLGAFSSFTFSSPWVLQNAFFLAVMAFDRYFTFCWPLHYPTLTDWTSLCQSYNQLLGTWFPLVLIPIFIISPKCLSVIWDH